MKLLKQVLVVFLSISLCSCVLSPSNPEITLIEKGERVVFTDKIKLDLTTPQVIPNYYSGVCVILGGGETAEIPNLDEYLKTQGLKAVGVTNSGKHFDMNVFLTAYNLNGVVFNNEISACAQTPECNENLNKESIKSFELIANKPVDIFGIYWEVISSIPNDDCAKAK